MDFRSIRSPAVAGAIALVLVGAFATSALADEKDFSFQNDSANQVASLYMSPPAQTSWGADWLGKDVLNPTESTAVSFTEFAGSTCTWDMNIILADGSSHIFNRVNMCDQSWNTFHWVDDTGSFVDSQ